MKKEKILALINVLTPIILYIVSLLTTELDQTLLFILILTLGIGFIMPFISLLITGICIFNKSHYKLSLVLNILNIPLTLFIITLLILVITKNYISFIISFGIIAIISIINTIYDIKYIKAHPNLETQLIKKEKKRNNGAIV